MTKMKKSREPTIRSNLTVELSTTTTTTTMTTTTTTTTTMKMMMVYNRHNISKCLTITGGTMEGRAAIFCDEARINDVGRSSALSAKPYNVEKHEEKRVAEGWPEVEGSFSIRRRFHQEVVADIEFLWTTLELGSDRLSIHNTTSNLIILISIDFSLVESANRNAPETARFPIFVYSWIL
ncbi:hypothetical protein V1478_003037 [Vespula squamosa]|uniref:Uncharacterized protein n=1 Tax=Vespula squamosa TaxID=30214 RepID=A0ABD2BRJ3_VESSQ